ncbi:hypothetical protein [Roseomonas sp. WA12]
MKPLPFALLPLLMAACAGPAPQAAGGGGAQGARAGVSAACTAEAERVVRYRDRGQLMRQDDYNARIGTSSYLGPQVITDQIAQVYDRDRMAAECSRNTGVADPSRPAAASPAAATPESSSAPASGGRRRR